jgi:hypothetical protein
VNHMSMIAPKRIHSQPKVVCKENPRPVCRPGERLRRTTAQEHMFRHRAQGIGDVLPVNRCACKPLAQLKLTEVFPDQGRNVAEPTPCLLLRDAGPNIQKYYQDCARGA